MTAQPHHSDEDVQLVSFRVGGHLFAFNVFEVERVLRYEKPSPLPKAPDFLEGMMPYGDGAVPVIDFRKRLEVPAENGEQTRTIILEWDQGSIGVVVDAVLSLLQVPVSAVKPPPPIVQGLAAEYVNGIIRKDGSTIIVLAVARILNSTERLAIQEFTADVS
jgi:purine-binding chemotaxis protein CheW